MTSRLPIYLDNQAHEPLDPRVAASIASAFARYDANPHSTHGPGEEARSAVEEARRHVADLIGAEPAEIVFTSGATEANNIAIRGIAPRLGQIGANRLLVAACEHPSVLAACEGLPGMRVVLLPLQSTGELDLTELDRSLALGAGLVSVAAANHEIGTVQDMTSISKLTRAAGSLLHTDLAQAAGKVGVIIDGIDLASVSAHKLGGPMGVGALYVRRSLRRHMHPITRGGGQEGGLRPGTVPVALCVGFGEACRLAAMEMEVDAGRVARLRDSLLERLSEAGGLVVNGGGRRLPGNLNVSFDGVDGEALVMRLRNVVAMSTGSACTSASLEPSHVLAAINVTGRRAEQAVRLSLGRATTEENIAVAVAEVLAAVRELRATTRRVA